MAQVRLQDSTKDQQVELPPEEQPKPPPAKPPAPAPVIVPPKALSTAIDYPPGQTRDVRVVLELVITAEGEVKEARALEPDAPFSDAAEKAAAGWKFEAATRDGKPVPARIRFAVTFEAPREEAEPTGTAPVSQPKKPQAKVSAEETVEILVTGERKPLRMRLSRAEVALLPGAFGDPFRAIDILPGVTPILSGLPYFYVRGAPPGNVGYLFEGIPVPALFHFGAGPGVLHPRFVEHVDLYPGAYPARYGRFAGGIVAGELAPPSYRLGGEATIRILDSGGMVEAPFAKGRGSIMLGGRYSYTAAVLSLLQSNVSVHYWDYQARVRYALTPRDSIELLTFGSSDLLKQKERYSVYDATNNVVREVEREETAFDQSFHRFDLRWDHALPTGRWRQAVMLGLDVTRLAEGRVRMLNHMIGARSELDHRVNRNTQLRAGADVMVERLRQRFEDDDEPDRGGVGPSPGPGPGETPMETPPMMPMMPMTPSSQADDTPDFGFRRARTDVAAGLRADLVIDVGHGVEFVPGLRTDLYVSGSDWALAIDPRLSARYRLSKSLTALHGIGLAHQMPSFVITIPGAKPSLRGGLQRAVQHSAGVEARLPWDVKGSVVLFQNLFFNLTDFIGLARLQDVQGKDLTNQRMTGRGYGLELNVSRSLTKKLGFLFSYTLSRSERFAGVLSGPATTDRTHVVNLALSYDLGKQWRVGGRGLYYTGVPAEVAYLEAARKPPRGPGFFRLDVRLQKRWTIGNGPGYIGFIIEMLNATLNKEVLQRSCNAYHCVDEEIGPVAIPNIGVEGAL